MLFNLDSRKIGLKHKELYLYDGAIRYPSLGMFVCPPDIPAEVYGMQLCFSLANDLIFTKNWGTPGYKLNSVVMDFTNSDYNLVKIREALKEYYKDINDSDDMLNVPALYNFSGAETNPRHGLEEIQNLIEGVMTIIRDEKANVIFINGISGYYDDNFYDCVSRLKKATVEHGACIIITHVVASVVYQQPVNGQSALREPLSHAMIRPGHLEASALMDWIWFVAPTTQSMIQEVSNSGIAAIPSGVNLYANKLVQPNKFISLSNLKFAQNFNKPWSSLFYFYKGPAPVLFDVELTGVK